MNLTTTDGGAAVGMTAFKLIGISLAQGSEYTLHWCMAKINAVPHIAETLQQHVISAIYSLSIRSTSTTPTHSKQYHTSEDIKLIKCLSDIICQVCKIKHILSVFYYTICGAVCFQFTHFLCDHWENIYLCLIIIIKSEVWIITHCLGLGHETMVSAVCLSIFLHNVHEMTTVTNISKL